MIGLGGFRPPISDAYGGALKWLKFGREHNVQRSSKHQIWGCFFGPKFTQTPVMLMEDVTKLLVDEDGDENTADHPKIELQPYGTLE
jgi:hypothetical protein